MLGGRPEETEGTVQVLVVIPDMFFSGLNTINRDLHATYLLLLLVAAYNVCFSSNIFSRYGLWSCFLWVLARSASKRCGVSSSNDCYGRTSVHQHNHARFNFGVRLGGESPLSAFGGGMASSRQWSSTGLTHGRGLTDAGYFETPLVITAFLRLRAILLQQ